MDMNLETNAVTKFLGQESDIQYVDEVVSFFFALSVVRSISTKAYVARFLRVLIRMYGALAFVMPLLLNGLPSEMMRNMDDYARMVVIAMVIDNLIPFGSIHPVVGQIVDNMCDISYAVTKANQCAMGYAAFASAFGGSIMAPLLGGFIAVNGHLFIEKGYDAFNVRLAGNADSKLAVCGGMVISVASNQLNYSPLMSRAILAALNLLQPYVDFDGVIGRVNKLVDGIQGSITGGIKKTTGGSSMKRGRSRTPSRR